MPPKRKVVLQANESQKPEDRKADQDILEARKKRFRRPDEEDDMVDYGGDHSDSPSQAAAVTEQAEIPEPQPQISPEEAERSKVTKALESWCNNNIAKDKDDPDSEERVAALAEVGLLLVFDLEKYNSADSMRSELEDIGSIIGGDQMVTRYINFILSLQNQLKKNRALAERQNRQIQHMAQQASFHPTQFHHFPMMGHPAAQPMFMPGPPHPMYMQPRGFLPTQPHAGSRGNMTLNATGEMTAIEKQREKERKRKEILAECTEHLKALLERVTKSTDANEKAKIYELIDKVKKRIESLKEVTPPVAPPKAPVPKGPIRGYFGNQYINPKLVEQMQRQEEKPDQ